MGVEDDDLAGTTQVLRDQQQFGVMQVIYIRTQSNCAVPDLASGNQYSAESTALHADIVDEDSVYVCISETVSYDQAHIVTRSQQRMALFQKNTSIFSGMD